ncbi:MAG: hypothetical protein H6712_27395 [Myxococcales bacterium]|nr:hypothetical protein [Myxococcales bacterium]MCB9717603.1 hypothetical protein [Myxococcales bacterium]
MTDPAAPQGEPTPFEPAVDDPQTASEPRRPWPARSLAWLRRNAYLALAAGAVLTVTEVVDFSPPEEVRVGKGDVAQLVGDAPPQEFSHELANPQAVQVRATLRLYPNNELEVAAPDPDTDPQGRLLSQPVVTTLLGMNATIDQTIRLEGGDLEVDLVLHGTPRLGVRPKGSEAPHPLTLEHELTVRSRRHTWWRGTPRRRVHVDSRGMLDKVDHDGYRLVFTVDDHLFSLDLELHRAGTPLPDSTLAAGP